VRFAICNELFEGWDWQRVCRFVKSAGYDGLEVAPFTLGSKPTEIPAQELSALRQQATDAGVQVIGLHWLLAKTEGLHLTSPDAAVRERTARYFVDLAKLCEALGGTLMVLGSPKQRSLLPGVTREQAFEFAADTLTRAMPEVASHGVTLCLEPLSPAETDFMNTCAEATPLIERIGHPNVKLHLDVKAMSSESASVETLIRRYGASAGHFHVNDTNLKGPGFGDTDFVPLFKAIEESGYDGWISVEVFDYKPDPEAIATGSVEYMKRCLEAAEIRSLRGHGRHGAK
jgi:sugar phosphate isomerase/epimerase